MEFTSLKDRENVNTMLKRMEAGNEAWNGKFVQRHLCGFSVLKQHWNCEESWYVTYKKMIFHNDCMLSGLLLILVIFVDKLLLRKHPSNHYLVNKINYVG
jgi:hypothetical protein